MADKRIQIKDKSGNKLYPAIDLSLSNNIGSLDGSRLVDATVSSSKLSGSVPIAKGGTGATTSSDARTNLGVYSKTEVDNLILGIDQFDYQVVTQLPTASVDTMFIIYLIASGEPESGSYVEWLTIDKGARASPRYVWEKIGTTAADLSEYSKNTHTHDFTGSQGNISVSGTYSKTTGITIGTGTGTVNYTPAGSISTTRSTDLSLNTTTVNSITAVGSLPNLTTSTVSSNNSIKYLDDASISHNFTINHSDPTFNTTDIYSITGVGTLPNLTFNTTAASGQAYIKSLSKSSYTPAGSVSATFTGSQVSRDVSITAAGSVSLTNGTPPTLTFSSVTSTGAQRYVQSISSTAASADGTDTFVKTISGGRGSLTTNTSSSGGIKYVESVEFNLSGVETSNVLTGVRISSSSKAVTLSGTVTSKTLEISASTPTSYATGVGANGTISAVTSLTDVITPTTKYLHHSHTGASVTGSASALTGVTGGTTTATYSYMKFAAGTTPKSSATFTGRATSGNITFTPQGTISASFTGTATNSLVTGGTTSYMHWSAGSLPTRSNVIKPFTGVSKAGAATLNGDVTLTTDKSYLTFNQGSLPTKGSNTTVVTGIRNQPMFNSTFTGSGVQLTATATNTETTISSTGVYTPSGTIGTAK